MVRTGKYLNVIEPISFAWETISGNAIAKHKEVAWKVIIAKPNSGGMAMRRP
ncbi:hypothetical protein D3C71_2245920 [compost metagenome]